MVGPGLLDLPQPLLWDARILPETNASALFWFAILVRRLSAGHAPLPLAPRHEKAGAWGDGGLNGHRGGIGRTLAACDDRLISTQVGQSQSRSEQGPGMMLLSEVAR